jgi:GNAT superfamily N-acetyltransferase
VAFSGETNLNYNVACSQSPSADVLEEHCLQPLLDLGQPGIVMLRGPGLAAPRPLIERSWVVVGSLPLILITEPPPVDADPTGIRMLTPDDVAAARDILEATYGLDPASAVAALPEGAMDEPGMWTWGAFDGDRLVACTTLIDGGGGIGVGWSMVTRPEYQRLGYGRRLFINMFKWHFEHGMAASVGQGSAAGIKLYRELGFHWVEYWQLWSRPRWALAF